MKRYLVAAGLVVALAVCLLRLAYEDALTLQVAVGEDVAELRKSEKYPGATVGVAGTCANAGDTSLRLIRNTKTSFAAIAASAFARAEFASGCVVRSAALDRMAMIKRTYAERRSAEIERAWAAHALFKVAELFGRRPLLVDAEELGAFDLEQGAKRVLTSGTRAQE